MAANLKQAPEQRQVAWRGFVSGSWQDLIDVREFIQRNYTLYEGDSRFLQGATPRTRDLWQALQPMLAKERERGILDVAQVPSGILRMPRATSTRSARSSSACKRRFSGPTSAISLPSSNKTGWQCAGRDGLEAKVRRDGG